MPRYIDADSLKLSLENLPQWGGEVLLISVITALHRTPTADVVPRAEVAREIFEEIEKAHDECIGVDITTRIGYFQQTKFEHKLAELKKKYTEG